MPGPTSMHEQVGIAPVASGAASRPRQGRDRRTVTKALVSPNLRLVAKTGGSEPTTENITVLFTDLVGSPASHRHLGGSRSQEPGRRPHGCLPRGLLCVVLCGGHAAGRPPGQR